jgi:hypothetical protein
VYTELFLSNCCCTVACLHNWFLAVGLHVIAFEVVISPIPVKLRGFVISRPLPS